MAPPTQSGGGGFANDFFSRLGDTFLSFTDRVGTEILPIWVGQQLDIQSTDQLFNPTFQGEVRGPVSTKADVPEQLQPPKATAGPNQNLVLIGIAALVGLLLLNTGGE